MDHTNTTRYRIENSEGRAWDSIDNRWRSLQDGRYTTYKTEGRALASARRIKAPMFTAYTKQIAKDRGF